MEPKEEKNSDLNRYKDPTGEFTNRELKYGKWYLENKLKLRRALVIFLVVWCVFFGGYALIGWGHYLFIGFSEDKDTQARQVAEFQNFTTVQHLYGAQPLQTKSVEIFSSTASKQDFVAFVQNPNERWVAKLTYEFVYDGGKTAQNTITILPQATVPVATLGVEVVGYPAQTKFEIIDVKWERINPHLIRDVAGFMSSRLIFNIENVSVVPPDLGGGVPAHRLTFDVHNEGAYSYWMGDFVVELVNAGFRNGIIKVTIPQFRAGTTRKVDVRIVQDNLAFDDIIITPTIDVFDQDVYIEPGS